MNKYGINEHLFNNFLDYFSPDFKNVKSIDQLNSDDILVVMKDGTKYLYDNFLKAIRMLPKSWDSITDDEFNKDCCLRLYSMMKRSGMSYESLSEQTGISAATICNYVNGRTSVTMNNLYKISKALGCKPEDLIYKD